MTKNAAIGIAAAAALVAILYFGHARKDTPAPAPVPEKPAPAVVVKPPVKPPGKPPVKDPKNPVIYHRVEQGGKQGPEQACTSVKSFAEGKSEAELAALAKQYGVTVAEVRKWFVCVQ